MEFMNQQGTYLAQDEIQLPDKQNIGFFMGPVPNERFLEEINNGIKMKKSIEKCNIEFFLTVDLMRFTEGGLESETS